jgi:hypothetical protein
MVGNPVISRKEHLTYIHQDINNKKLFIIDLAKGPDSVKIIDTKQPIGVTANIEGTDSSEVILAGAKDGVTKFNLKTGEHEYIAKYWSGPGAEDKAQRLVRFLVSTILMFLMLLPECVPMTATLTHKAVSG